MNEKIKEFFEKYILRWMIDDVGACVNNNANFGAVTLICCYVDFLGKLYTGDNDSGVRFVKFMDDYFDKRYGDYSYFIYKRIRCGMVHSFFPSKEGGIIRGYDRKDEHLTFFKDGEEEGILINVNILFDDFKQAILSYYDDLKRDEKLQNTFSNTLKEILEEETGLFEDLKKKILPDTKDDSDNKIPVSRSALSQEALDEYNKKIK